MTKEILNKVDQMNDGIEMDQEAYERISADLEHAAVGNNINLPKVVVSCIDPNKGLAKDNVKLSINGNDINFITNFKIDVDVGNPSTVVSITLIADVEVVKNEG